MYRRQLPTCVSASEKMSEPTRLRQSKAFPPPNRVYPNPFLRAKNESAPCRLARALWDLPTGLRLLDHIPSGEGASNVGASGGAAVQEEQEEQDARHGGVAEWDLCVLSVADAALRFTLRCPPHSSTLSCSTHIFLLLQYPNVYDHIAGYEGIP